MSEVSATPARAFRRMALKRALALAVVVASAVVATEVSAQAQDENAAIRNGLKARFPAITARDQDAYVKDGGNYQPAPELTRRQGVLQGHLIKGELPAGKVYPAVTHGYTLYVPQQYRGDRPVCLMVFLDGSSFLKPAGRVSFDASQLLDNLIAERSVPVMLGLFLDPGASGPGLPIYGGTGNRSIEYDSANPDLARFIVEEVLPAIKARYRISDDPACRGIMGASSSGSAAFGVAWNRPDQFGKVISSIGSFVDIRGAHQFPGWIRRTERKPIRVFLQDGRNDLDTIFGNWPLGSQTMASALAYRGYDYRFEYGDGGHNYRHMAAVAADAFRWVWRK